jgi:hypothetical protein
MNRYQSPPHNYLAWSICNLIFCCLPPGVVAIVFSVQSRSAAPRGDVAEAERTANTAKTCNMVATIGGGIVVVLIFFVLVLGGLSASHVNHP